MRSVNTSTANLANTIVATNVASSGGPDVFGAYSSGGDNLIGNTSDNSGWAATDLLDVDPQGFAPMDRRLMLTIIEKFEGGPVGVDSLAAALGEERGTIEDVIEPYLIQQGYLQRTPRGRIATVAAYRHLGLVVPAAAADLWSQPDTESSEIGRAHV